MIEIDEAQDKESENSEEAIGSHLVLDNLQPPRQKGKVTDLD